MLETILGTCARQLRLGETVMESGALTITGSSPTTCSGITREVKLPAASATVTVTLYWPGPSSVPAAGLWLIESWPAVQLSTAVMLDEKSGTGAWQFDWAGIVSDGGALEIVGGVLSITKKLSVP